MPIPLTLFLLLLFISLFLISFSMGEGLEKVDWWKQIYYQSICKSIFCYFVEFYLTFFTFVGPQRNRFEDIDKLSRIEASIRKRQVYPCFCYKPPQNGEQTTAEYEKYMVETKDMFILNK